MQGKFQNFRQDNSETATMGLESNGFTQYKSTERETGNCKTALIQKEFATVSF